MKSIYLPGQALLKPSCRKFSDIKTEKKMEKADSMLIEQIKSDIEKNRNQFLHHNIVRLREMIRYLSPEKLDLFKEIPFLIHINSPDFPGYIKSEEAGFGIWNFETSGMARDIAQNNTLAAPLLDEKNNTNPHIQAIYHIGSLGTFTQSVKSDFDFWVVIDESQFNETKLQLLYDKLSLITAYSREKFSQEVTFFVHYYQNLMINRFNNSDEEDLSAVPPMLLKEEFYRTFIMVAGKIPLWAVLPSGLDRKGLEIWREIAGEYGGFIDLGHSEVIPSDEIRKGLLWQICKSPYDPVKSVIKASITASYNTHISGPILLCDKVKQKFGSSIIDDYAADPYIIAFERILEYYSRLDNPKALYQIKAAIFFRLCGFPMVSLPQKDSPKRKILDRYVREWQLGSKRLKKLLDYQKWPEAEKILFDRTMVDRLSKLYGSVEGSELITESLTDSSDSVAEQHIKILKNKSDRIVHNKKGRLPVCSTFLRLKPQKEMILAAKEQGGTDSSVFEWMIFGKKRDEKGEYSYNKIYSSQHFSKAIGWSMYNHIYVRSTSSLEMKSPFRLYASLDKESSCDDIYIFLQPWMPLSDEPFASEPENERIVILLFTDNRKEKEQNKGLQQAEFLIRNSWGEMFFDLLPLEQIDNQEEKCYQISTKVIEYHHASTRYAIFQMAAEPLPNIIQIIKTIVEDTKIRKAHTDSLTRRPYLDTI